MVLAQSFENRRQVSTAGKAGEIAAARNDDAACRFPSAKAMVAFPPVSTAQAA
jgi:hypothetical protein